MERFHQHSGIAVAIDRSNIDTDQIIPKQFLKRIERTGYGQFLFYDWRFDAHGRPNPDFVLNDPRFKNATVLIAGQNFGCGSSREHAPWSLTDYGFRVIIAPSFADIFYNNSFKNGLLPIILPSGDTTWLVRESIERAPYKLNIDLEHQTLTGADFSAEFTIDPFRKHCLMNGLDDIELALQHESKIAQYELRRLTLSFSSD